MIKLIIIYNIIVFIFYGIDKYKAINNLYRISEKTLLLLSVFLGIFGAITGMVIFNHKTSSNSFKIKIVISAIFNATTVYCIYKFMV